MSEIRSYVAGGHVYCRFKRADMDVSECLGCARLKELNDRSSPPFLLCEDRDIPGTVLEGREFAQWWFQHHRRAR